MSRIIDKSLMSSRHASMLEYQSKIQPFTPTIRELKELWGLNTTCAVHLSLQRLESAGVVVSRKHGKTKSYFAKSVPNTACTGLAPAGAQVSEGSAGASQ